MSDSNEIHFLLIIVNEIRLSMNGFNNHERQLQRTSVINHKTETELGVVNIKSNYSVIQIRFKNYFISRINDLLMILRLNKPTAAYNDF